MSERFDIRELAPRSRKHGSHGWASVVSVAALAKLQRLITLAATRCECCYSGCDCGCVLDCPVHKNKIRSEA